MCVWSYYFNMLRSASSVQSLTTKTIFLCWEAINFYDAWIIAFKIWLWLASYLPISFIHILMMTTYERAKQNKATFFSNILYSGSLSDESNPSVSITLNPLILWNQTPFVHLYLVTVVSRTGNLVPNTWFNSVLFPELWVPKIAMFRLAFVN